MTSEWHKFAVAYPLRTKDSTVFQGV